VLRVKVVLKQPHIGSPGRFPRLLIQAPVIIYRDFVDMVDRADKEICVIVSQQVRDERRVGRPDPLAFEANNELDLVFIFLAQARSFLNVGYMSWPQI
jgi:hypothetical protein